MSSSSSDFVHFKCLDVVLCDQESVVGVVMWVISY